MISKVKIHFVGYSTQFDEWRYFGGDEGPEYFQFLRRERQFAPTDQSVEDREQISLVRCSIKLQIKSANGFGITLLSK